VKLFSKNFILCDQNCPCLWQYSKNVWGICIIIYVFPFKWIYGIQCNNAKIETDCSADMSHKFYKSVHSHGLSSKWRHIETANWKKSYISLLFFTNFSRHTTWRKSSCSSFCLTYSRRSIDTHCARLAGGFQPCQSQYTLQRLPMSYDLVAVDATYFASWAARYTQYINLSSSTSTRWKWQKSSWWQTWLWVCLCGPNTLWACEGCTYPFGSLHRFIWPMCFIVRLWTIGVLLMPSWLTS